MGDEDPNVRLLALSDGIFDACEAKDIATVRDALPARHDATGLAAKLGQPLHAGAELLPDDRSLLVRTVQDLVPKPVVTLE